MEQKLAFGQDHQPPREETTTQLKTEIVRTTRAQSEPQRKLQSMETHSDGNLAVPLEGDPMCPCSDISEILPLHQHTVDSAEPFQDLNLATYGFGCHYHDADRSVCRCNDNNDSCDNVPSWCHESWCWVRPSNCNLLFHRSTLPVNASNPLEDGRGTSLITRTSNVTLPMSLKNERYYSYATCRSIDAKVKDVLSGSLQGETIHIGMFHYRAGYLGSFHRDRKSFAGPIDDWSGPSVDFMREAARRGGFHLSVEAPPAFLRNQSAEFFGPSIPDLCVYATTLGFLDACVGFLLLNDIRASVTDWVILGHEPILLITSSEREKISISEHVRTLFTPFTTWTWAFIVLLFLPLMASIFVVHEYGQPGSIFPDREIVVYEANTGGTLHEDHSHFWKDRHVPFWNHLPRAIYSSTLGLMQMVYETQVITPGAKLHLIGFMFFELTLVAVYTANLTVILSKKHSNAPITEIGRVIERKWRICASRKVYDVVAKLHGIPPDLFVTDPTDGKPGIDTLPLAQRVMNSIDPVKAETDKRYCHVGLGYEQNVLGYHAQGLHCDKALVGKSVATIQYGFPLFDKVSPVLKTIVYQMKNDGWWLRLHRDATPVSTCPAGANKGSLGDGRQEDPGTKSFGFNLEDLTGIWSVSGGFAFLGLLLTSLMARRQRRRLQTGQGKYKAAIRYDQHGTRIKREYFQSISLDDIESLMETRGGSVSSAPRKRKQLQQRRESFDFVGSPDQMLGREVGFADFSDRTGGTGAGSSCLTMSGASLGRGAEEGHFLRRRQSSSTRERNEEEPLVDDPPSEKKKKKTSSLDQDQPASLQETKKPKSKKRGRASNNGLSALTTSDGSSARKRGKTSKKKQPSSSESTPPHPLPLI